MPTRKRTATVAGAKPDNHDTLTLPRARARHNSRPLTEEERAAAQEVFLATYARTANVSQSARRAHISRETFYQWRETDAAFRVRLDCADEDAQDVLRGETFRRSVVGVREPLTNGQGLIYEMETVLGDDGKPVLDDRGRPKMKRGKIATVKKYSDTLLAKMLAARVPEYREQKKQVEISGPHGGPIAAQVTNEQVLTINLEGMSVEQLRALRAALRVGTVDGSDSHDNSSHMSDSG